MQVEVTAELAKFAQPADALNLTEANMRSEVRAIVRSSGPERIATMLANADYRTLAAIVDVPAIATGLNDDLYSHAQERFRLKNVIKLLGLSANHRNKPALDALIAVGVNDASLEKEARAVLKNRAEKLEAVKLAESTIRRIISFSGLLTGKSDAEILAEIV